MNVDHVKRYLVFIVIVTCCFKSTAMYHPNISLADSNIGNDVAIEKSFYGAGILLMAALA
jgi:hypothetical protein